MIYFNYASDIQFVVTGSLNPQQEAQTFMAVMLQDWCSKIGPNYAELVTGPSQWQNASTAITSSYGAYTEVLLKGVDYRSGYMAANNINLAAWFTVRRSANYSYHYIRRGPEVDASDRYNTSLWGRNSSYGYLNYDEADVLASTSSGYRFYGTPVSSYAMYSDTPGQRFFSFYNMDNTNELGYFLIHEYEPIPGSYELGTDPGWIIMNYYGAYHPHFAGVSTTGSFARYGIDDRLTPTDGHAGVPSSANFAYGLSNSLAVNDQWGGLLGHHGGNLLKANTRFLNRFYTYEMANKRYIAVNDLLLAYMEDV